MEWCCGFFHRDKNVIKHDEWYDGADKTDRTQNISSDSRGEVAFCFPIATLLDRPRVYAKGLLTLINLRSYQKAKAAQL